MLRRTDKEIIEAYVDREVPVSAERQAELRAFVRVERNAEVEAVHLVRTYPPTEPNQALYAIETDQGVLCVVSDCRGSLALVEQADL